MLNLGLFANQLGTKLTFYTKTNNKTTLNFHNKNTGTYIY